MGKFKSTLVKRAREQEEIKEEQERLKSKYGVQEDVVVVEKSNMIKFMIRTGFFLFRILADIIIFFLSVVGLAALTYPVSRMELIRQAGSVWKQLMTLLG